jgi:hypothetical protein
MKNTFLSLLSILLITGSLYAQNTDSSGVSGEILSPGSSVGWQWSFGAGYRQTALGALNDRLFPGSVNGFDNYYVTGHIGFNIVIKQHLFLGLESNPFIVPNILSKPNHDHYFSGANTGLNLGYRVLKAGSWVFDLGYGLGFDYNNLLVQRTKSRSSSFEDAMSNPLTAIVSGFNATHRFSLRISSLSSLKMECGRMKQHSWGIEGGYILAGNNRWSDFNLNEISGPMVDNSGIFVRLVYASFREKIKKDSL